VVKPHGHWEGISVGTVVSIWLCYLLSTQDHRLVCVRDWVQARRELFNTQLGLDLRETDCSDDRLANVLTMLGDPLTQFQMDEAMLKRWVSIYGLPSQTIRLDSTGVPVHHQREGWDTGLLQFGFNREYETEKRQFKVMMATLDPLGLPITASTVNGECSDNLLYIPSYETAVSILGHRQVLVVGDSHMSALGTHGYLAQHGSHYLCPLNENTLPGETKWAWLDEAIQNPSAWQLVYREPAQSDAEEGDCGGDGTRTFTGVG